HTHTHTHTASKTKLVENGEHGAERHVVNTQPAVMDIMSAVQDACVSGQWLTAIILSLCCFLPSCLPAGQTVDYASSESVVSRQG
ncbi:hypothetical protein AMELA_G00185720, partial [Ameiurus melas]